MGLSPPAGTRYSNYQQISPLGANNFDPEQSVHLVRDELVDSMTGENAGQESDILSRRGDEKVILIQDSCPNYAKMDHF